jgi:hypothetical protein
MSIPKCIVRLQDDHGTKHQEAISRLAPLAERPFLWLIRFILSVSALFHRRNHSFKFGVTVK